MYVDAEQAKRASLNNAIRSGDSLGSRPLFKRKKSGHPSVEAEEATDKVLG